jgi:hypothetical protein
VVLPEWQIWRLQAVTSLLCSLPRTAAAPCCLRSDAGPTGHSLMLGQPDLKYSSMMRLRMPQPPPPSYSHSPCARPPSSSRSSPQPPRFPASPLGDSSGARVTLPAHPPSAVTLHHIRLRILTPARSSTDCLVSASVVIRCPRLGTRPTPSNTRLLVPSAALGEVIRLATPIVSDVDTAPD